MEGVGEGDLYSKLFLKSKYTDNLKMELKYSEGVVVKLFVQPLRGLKYSWPEYPQKNTRSPFKPLLLPYVGSRLTRPKTNDQCLTIFFFKDGVACSLV